MVDPYARAVLEAIPHWYPATDGPYKITVRPGVDTGYFSQMPPKGKTLLFLNEATALLSERAFRPHVIMLPSEARVFEEELALLWLRIVRPEIDWRPLLVALDQLSHRTHENQPPTINLVLSTCKSQCDVGLRELLELSPLGSTQNVAIRLDRRLAFLAYEEILWSQVEEEAGQKYHPEFLHPYVCALRKDDVAVSLTGRGDMIFLDRRGLFAARRKGRWQFHESAQLKGSLACILDNYYAGGNLIEVLFDLSYGRHGALLVFDRERTVLPHVVNRNSILDDSGGASDPVRRAIAACMVPIELRGRGAAIRTKRLFLDVAGLDGAVIFDAKRVRAFGAFVASHPDVSPALGSRTTAADSAYRWGGIAIKISADGEVSVYFRSASKETTACHAVMTFL